MEPKREVASIDLAAICRELGDVGGAFVDKAYLYPDRDLFRLKLRDVEIGRLELLAEVGQYKRCHLADPARIPEAPSRPPDFARMLRNQLEGGRVAAIEQVDFDRIVTIRVDVPDGSVDVVFELFGDGNAVVIGTDGSIVDCLTRVHLRSREVRPGIAYTPPTARTDPRDLDRESFHALMAESDTDVVRTLATVVNLGGRYAEELCTRADVDKGLAIEAADAAALDAVYDAITALFDRIESGSFDPCVYLDDDGVVDVSPVPLADLATLEVESFDTFSAALESYFLRLPDRTVADDRPDPEAERARFERIIEQQESAIEAYAEEAAAYRAKAEAVYAHYEPVAELLEVVADARAAGHAWEAVESTLEEAAERGIDAAGLVAGVDPAAGLLTIDLDGHRIDLEVGQSLEHNADRLYREAKAVEKKREGALDAVEETRREVAAFDAADAQTAVSSDEPVDWRQRRSIPIRADEHWYERFRWFRSSDGFLVIGGRNAKQNEELINKYAESIDRVLHAEAHGGPITLIKATAPDELAREVEFPQTTIDEAAQFAVSYSSVWKDGHYAGDAYLVRPEQMTKEAEPGEYLATGAFAVRGDRTYLRDVAIGVHVGIACEPETRVLGGPPAAIAPRVVDGVDLEPGRYASEDVANRLYRRFRERFVDERFIRKVASPDRIQQFLPPGTSRIVDAD